MLNGSGAFKWWLKELLVANEKDSYHDRACVGLSYSVFGLKLGLKLGLRLGLGLGLGLRHMARAIFSFDQWIVRSTVCTVCVRCSDSRPDSLRSDTVLTTSPSLILVS